MSRKGVQPRDQSRIEGTARQVAGHVKEARGTVTGNDALATKGQMEQAEGAVPKTFGKANDAATDG